MTLQVTKSIIVKGDVADIYQLWSDIETFPQFMKHIKKVKKTGDRSSHWTFAGPFGTNLAWDAETTRMEENQRIAWSSKQNGDIITSGQVTFTGLPNNQTEVTVTFQYRPPGGPLGKMFARYIARPETRLAEDLRCFKTYADTRFKGNLAL